MRAAARDIAPGIGLVQQCFEEVALVLPLKEAFLVKVGRSVGPPDRPPAFMRVGRTSPCRIKSERS